MEPSEQQLNEFLRFSQHWKSVVVPRIIRASQISDIAQIFQNWATAHGVLFVDIFSAQDKDRIIKLLLTMDKMDRCLNSVISGTYGLKFNEDKTVDIIAPLDMPLEEYQNDMITGFGVHPLIWVAVVGIVIVGSIWGVSAIIDATAKTAAIETEHKIIEGARQISEMSPEMQAALGKLIDQNRDKLEKAGLLDKLLGTGSGALIAGAIAAGLLLYAYMRSK